MRALALGALLGAIAIAGPASAYNPYDRNNCNGVAWDDGHPMVVAQVTARPRINFVKSPYDDDFKAEGCPAATEACRKTSYLLTRELVLVGVARGAYPCITYRSPLSKTPLWTSAWLPSNAIAAVAPKARPSSADWTGVWGPHGRITIRNGGGGKLLVKGVRVIEMPSGDTNNGTFTALLQPGPTTLTFTDEKSDGDCLVRMQRIDRWLFVEDNGGCGGAGVNFTGLYRRR
jgi:hypothetical protein